MSYLCRRITAVQYLLLAVALGVLLGGPRPSAAEEGKSVAKWGYNLSLYAWIPSLDGKLKYNLGGGDSSQEVDAGSVIEDIQTVFMGNFEVHKSRWSWQADYIYLDMADAKQDSVHINLGPGIDISTGASASLTGWYLGLSGAYQVYDSEKGTVYTLLGTRYLSLSTDITLNLTGPLPPSLPGLNLNASTEILDGVVGVKGRLFLGKHWYMPYHLDVGTGKSRLTWEAMTGIGYGFMRWDLLLVYRHLGFDEGDDNLL